MGVHRRGPGSCSARGPALRCCELAGAEWWTVGAYPRADAAAVYRDGAQGVAGETRCGRVLGALSVRGVARGDAADRAPGRRNSRFSALSGASGGRSGEERGGGASGLRTGQAVPGMPDHPSPRGQACVDNVFLRGPGQDGQSFFRTGRESNAATPRSGAGTGPKPGPGARRGCLRQLLNRRAARALRRPALAVAGADVRRNTTTVIKCPESP
jgi:hypothetical protein